MSKVWISNRAQHQRKLAKGINRAKTVSAETHRQIKNCLSNPLKTQKENTITPSILLEVNLWEPQMLKRF